MPECLARIVRAHLLLRSTGNDEKAEGAKELERAKALMRETGAMLFEAFINGTNVARSSARLLSTKAS